jgi:hypothetical protein
MSDKPEQDTEKPKQLARPMFWVLGFVAVILLGLVVYGLV